MLQTVTTWILPLVRDEEIEHLAATLQNGSRHFIRWSRPAAPLPGPLSGVCPCPVDRHTSVSGTGLLLWPHVGEGRVPSAPHRVRRTPGGGVVRTGALGSMWGIFANEFCVVSGLHPVHLNSLSGGQCPR